MFYNDLAKNPDINFVFISLSDLCLIYYSSGKLMTEEILILDFLFPHKTNVALFATER